MSVVYLIGMPGCGKSTIGRLISSEMNMEFVDLDSFIVEETGKTIERLFEHGESHFRRVETECLKKISTRENTIVATGGGIIVTEGNAEIMKSSGKVIFIHTPPELIIENSALDGRPLLAGNKNKIFELFRNRYPLYVDAADVIVENTTTIDEAVKNITATIKKS